MLTLSFTNCNKNKMQMLLIMSSIEAVLAFGIDCCSKINRLPQEILYK